MGHGLKIAIFILIAILYCPNASASEALPIELARQVLNNTTNDQNISSNTQEEIAYQKISNIFIGRKPGNLNETLEQYPLHNPELTSLIKLYAQFEAKSLEKGQAHEAYKALLKISNSEDGEVGFMANLLLSVFHLKRYDTFIGMKFVETANDITSRLPSTRMSLNYQYDATDVTFIAFILDRNKDQSISTLETLLRLSEMTNRSMDGFVIVNNIAMLYERSNSPFEAIKLIKTAAPYLNKASEEQQAIYYYSLGMFQTTAKNYGEAVKSLSTSAELNKNPEMQSSILFQLTKAYANNGSTTEALKFKALLNESPNAGLFSKNLIKIDSRIAELQGRDSNALTLYKKWSESKISTLQQEVSDDRRTASKRIALSQELSNQKLEQIISENALKDQIIVEQKRKNKAYLIGLALSGLAILVVLFLASRLNQSRKIAEKARDQAKEGERAKTQILSAMSHEFRTPLNAIIPVAEILGTMHKDAPTRGYLKMIKLAGESLLSMMENLYVLANGSNAQQYFAEALDLKKQTQEILTPWIEHFDKKGVTLKAFMPTHNDNTFEFDKRALKLILDNLVSNALKFTQQGTVELTINRITLQDIPHIKIIVKDSGVGIDLDKIDLYLSPFTQSDMSLTRSYDGLGIGLAAVKTCLEKYNGTISFENNEDVGTTATVLFPLEHDSENKIKMAA